MNARTLLFGRWFLIAVVAFCLCGGGSAQTKSPASGHERDDIAQAEKTVLASLAVATSQRGQSLCIETPIACVGPDKLELAMSLLAARSSPESLRALAGLVRYGLDGANSEDYHDLVIGKGQAMEPVLVALSPQRLHAQCQKEFAELMRTSGSALGEVRENYVCRSEEEIKADISSTLDAIRHHRKPE
jgi:hypothetical protein